MDKNLQKLVSEYMRVTPDIEENDVLVEDLTKEEGLAGMFLVLPDEKVRAFEDNLVESEIPQRRAHMRQLLSQENALQVILSNLLKKGGYSSYLNVLQTMFNSVEELLSYYGLMKQNNESDFIPSDIVDSSDNYEPVNNDYADIEDEPIEAEDDEVIPEPITKEPEPAVHSEPTVAEPIVNKEPEIVKEPVKTEPVKEINRNPEPVKTVIEQEPVKNVITEQPATSKFEEANHTYAREDIYNKTENDMLREQNKQLNETLVAMQDMMKSFIEMQQSQARFVNAQYVQEPVIPQVNTNTIEAVQPVVEDESLTDEEFYNCIEIVKSKVGNMSVLDFIVKEFEAGNRDSAAESLEQIIINLEKGGVKFD